MLSTRSREGVEFIEHTLRPELDSGSIVQEYEKEPPVVGSSLNTDKGVWNENYIPRQP